MSETKIGDTIRILQEYGGRVISDEILGIQRERNASISNQLEIAANRPRTIRDHADDCGCWACFADATGN